MYLFSSEIIHIEAPLAQALPVAATPDALEAAGPPSNDAKTRKT